MIRRSRRNPTARVLCGIEAEVYPDESHMEPMDEIMNAYQWDFVLGSLHAQCASYRGWTVTKTR